MFMSWNNVIHGPCLCILTKANERFPEISAGGESKLLDPYRQ
jgi:hypothetical protein